MDASEVYDLAVSFAGEQRSYVEQVVRACQKRGLSVFYDRDVNNEWWGRNYIREQRKVYSSQTRFFVPFISTEYLAKPVPGDEFSAAMMTAIKQGDGYILPVLVGDVQVPVELLHPHVHHLRANDHTPEQLAEQLAKRVGRAEAEGQAPRDMSAVVGEVMQLRMPKVVPQDFSSTRSSRRASTTWRVNIKQPYRSSVTMASSARFRERPIVSPSVSNELARRSTRWILVRVVAMVTTN